MHNVVALRASIHSFKVDAASGSYLGASERVGRSADERLVFLACVEIAPAEIDISRERTGEAKDRGQQRHPGLRFAVGCTGLGCFGRVSYQRWLGRVGIHSVEINVVAGRADRGRTERRRIVLHLSSGGEVVARADRCGFGCADRCAEAIL